MAFTLNQDNQDEKPQQSSVSRAQETVETFAKEFIAKLDRLDQLIDQMKKEELSIREQMQRNCRELRGEVESIEEKQRKIQEVLDNFRDRS